MATPISSAADGVTLLATGQFAGDSLDASGLTGQVETGVPVALLGGFSGLEYTGDGNRYWAITDRGPADGAATYPCRFHEIELALPTGNDLKSGRVTLAIKPKLIATHLLRDSGGDPLSGRSSRLPRSDGKRAALGTRFDPEAIRRQADGSLWISDEYGPYVARFEKTGRELERLVVPPKFLIDRPSASRDDENNGNDSGRRANGGFEGLATSFTGDRLLLLAQRPLIQDSAREGLSFQGVSCRLLELPLTGVAKSTNASKPAETKDAPRELLYPLDLPGNGLNEILAWDERYYLVIERDDAPGAEASFKKIMVCDLASASNIADIARLPARRLPVGVKPIAKRVLIDLLDSRWKLAGAAFPEKIEGLARGPLLPDGRRLLVVGSDNDCDPIEPSRFWLFAVPSDL
ncbi:MAG: esterase-like activity of phytase family protein [Planctomycetota bacterium]